MPTAGSQREQFVAAGLPADAAGPVAVPPAVCADVRADGSPRLRTPHRPPVFVNGLSTAAARIGLYSRHQERLEAGAGMLSRIDRRCGRRALGFVSLISWSGLVLLSAGAATPAAQTMAVAAATPAGVPALPAAKPVVVRTVAPLAGAPQPLPPANYPADRPAPRGSLARASLPARGDDTLVEVVEPGRFAIAAESATGLALQLVDMIAGPGEPAGEPGVRDGRLDVLLDRGTYKLRGFGAAAAAGEAKLSITGFRETEGASSAFVRGGATSTRLADFEQRSYWLAVPAGGRLFVEATGRSLADLRLWRGGSDLVEVPTDVTTVEAEPARPMTRIRLDGTVEPGLYLVTAYGGPALPWADGAPDEPLHVRLGPPGPLAAGVADGVIGPSGTALLEVPAAAGYLRLELPEPAEARLAVISAGRPAATATLSRTSREPIAVLDLPSQGKGTRIVEVAGRTGQPFRLVALDRGAARSVTGAGPHLVEVALAGDGGDEPPATIVLARFDAAGQGAAVLAGEAPRVGPARAWRARFNLRGPTSLLFEATAAMPLAVATGGPGVKASVAPLLGTLAQRGDGRTPDRYDLEPGWYELRLEPVDGAVGILDVTIGPPGLKPERAEPQPRRALVSFGVRSLDKGATYQILANAAPGLVAAPVVRALPIDLDRAPVALWQPAGETLELPVRMPVAGAPALASADGAAVAAERVGEAVNGERRTFTLRVPPADAARLLVASWSDPEARVGPLPALPQEAALATATAGTPVFFDLGRDEGRSFALDVPEGGLYKIETLGRLRTSAAVSTSFIPRLDAAEANGAGQNALIQTYLRAGRYRVGVGVSQSAGRLGLTATPATLAEADALVPGGSARATLAEGRGAVFPIEIGEAGRYRLDLYGLSGNVRARLEDAEGWPLTAPGDVEARERRLEAGRYRLVALPQPVATRVVARLEPIVRPTPLAGHGPHSLPFDAPQAFQWREPEAADAPRVPDQWTFALEGEAEISLSIGEGMVADLVRTDGGRAAVARIAEDAGFSGRLGPGSYVVEARGLGRNDRLDYEIALSSAELQPGTPRWVDVPASVPFAVAEDRLVSLTSFGTTDFRAVVRDDAGAVVERLDDRTDDWNVAFSRPLPAGRYVVELMPASPGQARRTDEAAEASDGGDEAAAADGEAEEGEADADEPVDGPAPRRAGIELRLALPAPVDAASLAFAGSVEVLGPAAHRMPLPAASEGSLMIVAAEAAAELGLSIERRDGDGRWRLVALERGRRPVLAVPAGGAAELRASVWPVDGDAAAVRLVARAVEAAAQPLGRVALAPVDLAPLSSEIAAGLVAVPSAGLVTIDGSGHGLAAGSSPGRALASADGLGADGLLAPQSERLWLLGRTAAAARPTVAAVPAGPGALAFTLPEGGTARLPAAAAPAGTARLWLARSTFGEPGLDAGRGMGIPAGGGEIGSAVALAAPAGAADAPLKVWNAGGDAPLRLELEAVDLTLEPPTATADQAAVVLPARTARPLRLPDGVRRLSLDLAPGTAAVAAGADGQAVTVWSGDRAASRTVEGAFATVTLINPSDVPVPMTATLAPLAGAPARLAAGGVLKRFFGAAGAFELPVAAVAGDRLVVVGAAATFVGDDGRVRRGERLDLSGPGRLVVAHGEGLVAAWLEHAGTSPWPAVAARPLDLPGSLALSGEAMTLTLAPAGPALLNVRTTAPVILALAEDGAEAQPRLFPAGAAFHHPLAGGPAELRLFSPHDGPLAGVLEATATPVVAVGEGLGAPVAVAPGGTALFGFTATRAGPVGIGVRAEPDRVAVRLLDAAGAVVGEGRAQLEALKPGRYFLEARVPADGATTLVRPAVVGIEPPPAGPPPDVAAAYLALVGLAPAP